MASAKPATAPELSADGVSATLNTVPEVPIETITSPGSAPTPSAAAALSPVPGPSGAPLGSSPARPVGPSTTGTTGRRPNACSSRSSRYSPVRGDQ